MYGIIYKITNTINNKVYIGQTTQTLKRRFADHKSRAKIKNGYLYKAIRTYSAEKFKIEQIDIAHTKEYLDLYSTANGSDAGAITITPSTSENSRKIPTTAWVNNKFQVVSALPASPDSNVFYFIPA